MSGGERGSAAEEQPIRITEDMLDVGRPVDTRIDFEQGMSYAPPATLMLIVALAAVFLWQLDTGVLSSQERIIAAGALVRDRVTQGEWWRLPSATMLHGNAQHLVGNAVSLYILGMASEHAYGTRPMLLIYLVSGVAGSLLSIAMGPGPSVGASGAIFGLMGALLIVFIKSRGDVRGILTWIGINFVITFVFVNSISWEGHLGGFIGGTAIGAVLVYTPRGPRRTTLQVAGLTVIAALIAIAIAVRSATIT
jgi:rhomboid protease GluP